MRRRYELPGRPDRPDALETEVVRQVSDAVRRGVREAVAAVAGDHADAVDTGGSTGAPGSRGAPRERFSDAAIQAGGAGYATPSYQAQGRPITLPLASAGNLPTREQLDEEVDRSFREFFPDAPKRLDPDDPEQAELVSTWVGLRDGILNEWTDRVFFASFPYAPKKLDPSNSADAQLIDFWTDIRDQIRDGAPGRHHWGPQAPVSAVPRARTSGTKAAPSGTKSAPPLRILDIHNFGRHRLALDFDTDPTIEAATALVFPAGAPPGVLVSVYGPRQILLEHVTQESLSSMPTWLQKAFVEATQGIENDPRQRAAASPRPAGSHGKPHPEIEIDTPEEAYKWIEEFLHKLHEVADVAELAALLAKMAENLAYARAVAQVGVEAAEEAAWGGAGVAEVMQYRRLAGIARLAEIGRVTGIVAVLEVVSKVVSVFGDLALILLTAYELIKAFEGEKEGEHQFGFLYGIMWQALGEPDHIRVYNSRGTYYTAEELRDAFVDGVAEGRKKGAETEIRHAVWLMVAAESGLPVHRLGVVDVWVAAHQVITDIDDKWAKTKSRNQLDWPTPFPYTGGLIGLLSNQQ